MKPILYGYMKCSTTKDAIKILKNNNIDFDFIDVKEQAPSKETLKDIVLRSQLDIKKFFNTSGLVYRKLNLKDTLSTLTDDEKLQLLSEHGMLIKRVVFDNHTNVLVGPLKQEMFL